MNFDPNQFLRRPSLSQIMPVISCAIGAILIIVSLFLPYPSFIYTASIGAALVLIFLIFRLVSMKKQRKGPFAPRAKKQKKANPSRVQKAAPISGDPEHVISVCPHCGKKLRLPNRKGKHSVQCPICKKSYDLRIR